MGGSAIAFLLLFILNVIVLDIMDNRGYSCDIVVVRFTSISLNTL